jgi:hypothetical protein
MKLRQDDCEKIQRTWHSAAADDNSIGAALVAATPREPNTQLLHGGCSTASAQHSTVQPNPMQPQRNLSTAQLTLTWLAQRAAQMMVPLLRFVRIFRSGNEG